MTRRDTAHCRGGPQLCDGAISKNLVGPETGRESRIPTHLAQNDPQIRQTGAARNSPSIEGFHFRPFTLVVRN